MFLSKCSSCIRLVNYLHTLQDRFKCIFTLRNTLIHSLTPEMLFQIQDIHIEHCLRKVYFYPYTACMFMLFNFYILKTLSEIIAFSKKWGNNEVFALRSGTNVIAANKLKGGMVGSYVRGQSRLGPARSSQASRSVHLPPTRAFFTSKVYSELNPRSTINLRPPVKSLT